MDTFLAGAHFQSQGAWNGGVPLYSNVKRYKFLIHQHSLHTSKPTFVQPGLQSACILMTRTVQWHTDL